MASSATRGASAASFSPRLRQSAAGVPEAIACQVTAALAAADPAALAALDPGRDQELFVAGRAAWQVLAGAASAGAFTADLRYAAAPFEVSYYVATWMLAHRAH